jgi:PRTRC genetic system protein C
MSALVISPVRREFIYNGTSIPDPDPKMTPEQVRDSLVAVYPEIATAPSPAPSRKTTPYGTPSAEPSEARGKRAIQG